MIEDNAQAKAEYQALGLKPKEFVKVRSGELELDAWMIKPANFDASKNIRSSSTYMENQPMLPYKMYGAEEIYGTNTWLIRDILW